MNELDHFIFCRVHAGAGGILAVLHRLDLIAQKFAKHDDAAVAFAQVFYGAVGDGTLGFPSHVILAGKIIQVKFTVGVFGADVFDGRIFRLFRNTAVFGRTEAELIDLGIKIVDRRPEVQGIAATDGDKKDVGKNQRVGRFHGNLVAGEDALFLDAGPVRLNYQLKIDFAERLIVKRDEILSAL